MCKNPADLITKLNTVAPNIGMGYEACRRMINSMLFAIGEFVIDMNAFEEWVEEEYPEYMEQSIETFLKDKDPSHISVWEEILGVC